MSRQSVTTPTKLALRHLPILLVRCWLVMLISAWGHRSLTAMAQSSKPPRRVNAPHFDGDVRYAEMALVWFGCVSSTDNYADVRVGCNDQHIYVNIAVFDRYLWYDTTPAGSDLIEWDAATLFLDLNHDGGSVPALGDYRFIGQLVWWEGRDEYQAAYLGDGSDWLATDIPFISTSGWRGNAPNDGIDDRGWTLGLYIPFESLGLPGPPPPGATWGMALALHDRDDGAGTLIDDKIWSELMSPEQPGTWAELRFGLPTYTLPPTTASQTTTIRHKLDGTTVADAAVGGTIDNLCPGDPEIIWHQWGNANFAGAPNFNLQNQADVADWPCFAKYYVNFPLSTLPPGKAIISATLTLHEWGGSDPSQAQPSLIQVFTVADDWEETTINWNNAPMAVENVSMAWVEPLASFPGWPGVPWTWDVSGEVAEAYASRESLRLSYYEADAAYHSGKYFVSSDTGDWNAEGRPTLRVRWGDPKSTVDTMVSSVIVEPGDLVTYTLTVVGSAQPLTLTDELPTGVSSPITHSSDLSYTTHRVSWSSSPGVGEPVALTYAVTVVALTRVSLWNQAKLTETSGMTYTATALVLVDPAQQFLPLVLDNESREGELR